MTTRYVFTFQYSSKRKNHFFIFYFNSPTNITLQKKISLVTFDFLHGIIKTMKPNAWIKVLTEQFWFHAVQKTDS